MSEYNVLKILEGGNVYSGKKAKNMADHTVELSMWLGMWRENVILGSETKSDTKL